MALTFEDNVSLCKKTLWKVLLTTSCVTDHFLRNLIWQFCCFCSTEFICCSMICTYMYTDIKISFTWKDLNICCPFKNWTIRICWQCAVLPFEQTSFTMEFLEITCFVFLTEECQLEALFLSTYYPSIIFLFILSNVQVIYSLVLINTLYTK